MKTYIYLYTTPGATAGAIGGAITGAATLGIAGAAVNNWGPWV